MSPFSHQKILAVARLHRNYKHKPSVIDDTAGHGFPYTQYHVYVVKYDDGSTCAIHVPIYSPGIPPKVLTVMIAMEVSTLKRLASHRFDWSPRVLASDTGYENALRFPYMILSCIEGKPLTWTDSFPDRSAREKVLMQLANILHELWSCAERSRDDGTTESYLLNSIDRDIAHVKDGQLREVSLSDCLDLRMLARRMVHEPTTSSFAICHEDLTAQNIIADYDFNIKGVIEWGFGRSLPLQFAIRFPRFLSIEPEIQDGPVPKDIRSFSSAFLSPSATLKADRRYFISQLLSAIKTEGTSPAVRQLVPLCLQDPDVDWKQLVFEATWSKGWHRWMARRSWLLPGTHALSDDSTILHRIASTGAE